MPMPAVGGLLNADAVKVAIPVVTFAAGYLLKSLGDRRARARDLATALLSLCSRWLEELRSIESCADDEAMAHKAWIAYQRKAGLIIEMRALIGRMERHKSLVELTAEAQAFRLLLTHKTHGGQRFLGRPGALRWDFLEPMTVGPAQGVMKKSLRETIEELERHLQTMTKLVGDLEDAGLRRSLSKRTTLMHMSFLETRPDVEVR